MKKRISVVYSGVVQGVGFRFTAQRAARDNNLTGWVKNLPDGRVEVTAEGDETNLKAFINDIKKGFLKNYIEDSAVEWSESKEEFRDFRIEY
jgi:acylphosphatase